MGQRSRTRSPGRISTPSRSGRQIERRLTELWNYARYSPPIEEGGKYFYLKNDGLQNQAVLYVADSYDGEGRVLFDPNKWSKDGTIALADFAASDDGKLLAYARSEAGSDWQQIYVRRRGDRQAAARPLEVGPLQRHRPGPRTAAASTTAAIPSPPPGEQYQSAATNQMIYFHKLGTKQADDALIYRRPDHPDWSFGVAPTDDGKYLVLVDQPQHRSAEPGARARGVGRGRRASGPS